MNNHKLFLGNKVNAANVKTLDLLKNINPKYAEHMYFKNRIVEAFAISAFGGVDILDQPVCGHCEKPGFWHGDKTMSGACYCPGCGSITKNAVEMRDYLSQELKLPTEVMEQLELMMYAEVKND
jgi:hypothetical protein